MKNPDDNATLANAERNAILEVDLHHTGIQHDSLVKSVGERNEMVSWFDSVTSPNPSRSISLWGLADRVRSEEFETLIEPIRKAAVEMRSSSEDSKAWNFQKKVVAGLKSQLPAFTVSGVVTSGGRARAGEDGRFRHSGLLQIDVDRKDNPGTTVEQIKQILIGCRYIEFVATSPSGDGVKAFCRIPCVETRAGADADPNLPTHKDAYACAEKYFGEQGLKIDASCRDAARLCYVTHDPSAWVRPGRADELPVTSGADRHRRDVNCSTGASSEFTERSSLDRDYDGTPGLGLDDLESMLAAIGPKELTDGRAGNYGGYGEWIKIINAAYQRFGEAAIPYLERWRPCAEGELQGKLRPENRLKKVKFGTLIKFAKDCGWQMPQYGEGRHQLPSDVFPIPKGDISISDAARHIFSIIAPSQRLYVSQGTVCEIEMDQFRKKIAPVIPIRFCSLVENFGCRVMRLLPSAKDDEMRRWAPGTLSKTVAEQLLQTDAAREILPPIRQVVSCPLFTSEGILNAGYHKHAGGSFVGTEDDVAVLHPQLAKPIFLSLLEGFRFAAPGDRSRAAAHLLGPALKMGAWIRDDYPLFVVEADQSQSGKSYLLKMVAALYNESPNTVVFTNGGVGSADEAIASALITGRPLVTFDNVRGKLASQLMESSIRGLGAVTCRTLRHSTEVDSSAFLFQLSTNGAEMTRDLANRSLITCIRKHPADHTFEVFEQGDLLDRIRALRRVFLGSVFGIIKEWQRQGCARTDEKRHDFRGFCQSLDWIVQKILDLPPLLEGNQERQVRVSDDRMVWLRCVVIEVEREGLLGQVFSASCLAEFAEGHGLLVPSQNSRVEAHVRLGTLMASVFRQHADGDVVRVDDYSITREIDVRTDDRGRKRQPKSYTIRKLNLQGG